MKWFSPAAILLAASAALAAPPGADVVYSDCTSITTYGPESGIRAYSLGTYTCNLGDATLLWGNAVGRTPVVGFNAYRIHNGSFQQIGMSWCKLACCAASGTGCGVTCNTAAPGSGLKPGCRDIYGAGYNANQGSLGPRSAINPYSGSMTFNLPAVTGAVARRLQVNEADLNAANFPGAHYIVEGVYVGTDDAQNGNWLNNASYKLVNLAQGTYAMTPVGSMQIGTPAIFAWRDHGLGQNIPDPSVTIVNVDVPAEGRFVVGSKARNLGGGFWKYEYAVFNLNSHVSARGVSIPLPPGTTLRNLQFQAPPYHSGEPYSNNPWTFSNGTDELTIATSTYTSDQNANAVRWGTTYSMSFEADVAPASQPGNASLLLFRPHTVGSATIAGITIPGTCAADFDNGTGTGTKDGAVTVDDLVYYVGLVDAGDIRADIDNGTGTNASDGGVTIDDFLYFLFRYDAGC